MSPSVFKQSVGEPGIAADYPPPHTHTHTHIFGLIGNHSLSTAGARDIRSIVIIIIFSWSVESEGVEFAAQ